jgi:hypothetical protein
VYSDTFHLTENENLYTRYINYLDPGSRGVPDLFINGTVARVQGAFDALNTRIRIEKVLEPFLIDNCYYALEPNISDEPGRLKLSTRIARLGSRSGEDILVKAVVIRFIGSPDHQRVVRAVKKSNLIERIGPGEVKEVAFADYEYQPPEQLSVVFLVTSGDELDIYQSVKVAVK